ncbi:hypothetical protein L9F63_000344, partial [Diploptera punctata]
MHMSYWFGNNVNNLLFKDFTLTTATGLIVTCFALCALGILLEVIKVHQASLIQKNIDENEHCRSHRCSSETDSLIPIDAEVERRSARNKLRLILMLKKTFLYGLQIVLSYILMLCVMTYNGYFTIAVALGASVGYLVCGPYLLEAIVKNTEFMRPKKECRTCL